MNKIITSTVNWGLGKCERTNWWTCVKETSIIADDSISFVFYKNTNNFEILE